MGLSADAEVIWGIPVLAHDPDTGDPTPFWSEEDEDWRTFEGEIEVHTFGHYADPDGPRGILTSTRVESLRGDCWTPKAFNGYICNVPDKVYSKSEDQARAAELPVSFYESACWYLVASYG